MKKYLFAGLLGLLLLSYLPASAMTQQDIQSQIQELMQQVQALQAKLNMPGGSGGQSIPTSSSTSSQTVPSPTNEFCYTFNQDLKAGDGYGVAYSKTNDVSALQSVLQKEGFSINSTELKGNSVSDSGGVAVFGQSTAAAVVGFQEKYASEILTPNGLAHGTGFVGASTRAKLNALYGCDNTTTSTDTKPKTDIKLAADEVTQTSIKLNWSPRINFSAISPTKYVLYRGSTVIYSGQAFSFTDTGLQCGISYTYKLVATGGSGFSDLVTNETYGPITVSTDSCGDTTSTTTPSIAVISPNGGDVWAPGETHRILWKSNGVNNIKIYIYDPNIYGSGSTQYVTQNGTSISASSGYYDWVVPALSYLPGHNGSTHYKIRIDSADTNTSYTPPSDSSDDYFTITSSSTTTTGLAAPTGVTASAVSQTASLLTWNPVTGADGYNIYESGSLKSRVRGATFWYDTNLSCGTTHTYAIEAFHYDSNWNLVPSGNLSSYVISQTKSCSDAKPYIKVTSPNGGEMYKPGSTVRITWIATGVTDNANSIAVSVFKYRSDNNYYGVKPEFGVTVSNFVTNGVIQDNGSYDWTIPTTYAGQYVIMVGGGPYGLKDYSDGAFTVSNTTQSNTFTIEDVHTWGNGSTYLTTDIPNLSFIGRKSDGSNAGPAEGFYSQAYISNQGGTVQGINVSYDYTSKRWIGVFPKPLAVGNYILEISLYCSNSLCNQNYGSASQQVYRINFTVISSTTNKPVIYGVSGPQQLNINQQGTWSISASDSSGGSLSYSVDWGDTKVVCQSGYMCANAIMPSTQQSATFTHTYNSAGTFSPVFTVTNSSGQSEQTSLNVQVGGAAQINHSPSIGGVAVPVSVQAGQLVNFNFNATDADNDNLSWSLNWGDGSVMGTACEVTNPQQKHDWTYGTSYAWKTAGTYTVKVSVSDCRGGTDSTSFTITVLGNPVPTPTAPGTPTSFSASGVSVSQIAMSWAPVSGATSYTVTRYPGGGVVYTGSSTSASDTGLQCGTSYTYTVSASNSSGTSSTASASASTSACSLIPLPTCDYAAPPKGCTYVPGPSYNKVTQCGMILNCSTTPTSIPTTPTSFSASGVSTSQIAMSWAPVSGATSYTVTRYPGGGIVYTGSSTSVSDTGLQCGTVYTYTVYASNGLGSSSTASASASTSICSTSIPPSPAPISVPTVSATQSNQLQASILEIMRGLLNTMLQAVQ